MKQYVFERLIMAVITLFIITLALFIMEKAMPGTPFNDARMSDEQLRILYSKYGLDKSILTQYWNYMSRMISGDFGVSYSVQVNTPVSTMILQRFPISLQIGLQATILGSFLGFGLGVIAALKRNTLIDNFATIIAILGVSLPNFVLALILSLLFSYTFNIFPALYRVDQPFTSTILPSIALSAFTMANIQRYARAEMIDVMNSDFYRLADAKGITRRQLIRRHMLRNTLIPVITVLAPLMVDLIAGSMVVEKAFSIPGLGTLYISAIQANDYNVVLGITFFYAVLFISIMLLVDILYVIIDPRVRLSKG